MRDFYCSFEIFIIIVDKHSEKAIEARFGFDKNDQEVVAEHERYQKMGEYLRDNSVTKDLFLMLCNIAMTNYSGDSKTNLGLKSNGSRIFAHVAQSSGMGKTQMAFNIEALIRHNMEVNTEAYINKAFYILGSDFGEDTTQQPIYRYFDTISKTFGECAKRDAKILDGDGSTTNIVDKKLYTFAFINELLSGNYGLDLMFDLEPMKMNEVENKFTSEERTRIVVFMDEFCPVHSISSGLELNPKPNESILCVMRNCFRVLKILVVTMGTEARAVNLIKMGNLSRGGSNIWCMLWTKLPKFCLLENDVFFKSVNGKLLKYIADNSRPLFGASFLEIYSQEIQENGAQLNLDHVLAKLFEKIAIGKKFKSNLDKGVSLAQVALMMNVYYMNDCDENNNAYYNAPLIHRHFGQLQMDANFVIFNSDFQIMYGTEFSGPKWKPLSAFPSPEEDLLLHLCFGGNVKVGATFNAHLDRVPFVAQLNHVAKGSVTYMFQNKVQTSNDGSHLEAIFAASACTVSRLNGLQGILFPDFLSMFSYQLSTKLELKEFKTTTGIDQIDMFSEKRIPFMSVANTKWPLALHEVTPDGTFLANSERLMNSDRADWRCSDMNGKLLILGECKYRKNGLTTKDLIGAIENFLEKMDKKETWLLVLLTSSTAKNPTSIPAAFIKKLHENEIMVLNMDIGNDGSWVLHKVTWEGYTNADNPKKLLLIMKAPHVAGIISEVDKLMGQETRMKF